MVSGAEIIDLTEDITSSESEEYMNKLLWLRRGDFQSLSGSRYLNDRIIDEYLKLIRERNEADARLPGIYTCKTLLYTSTVEKGLKHTERWVKEDLRMKDLIFFPIHHDGRMLHWSLAAVETSTKTVNYFDSLGWERISSNPEAAILTRKTGNVEVDEAKQKIMTGVTMIKKGIQDLDLLTTEASKKLAQVHWSTGDRKNNNELGVQYNRRAYQMKRTNAPNTIKRFMEKHYLDRGETVTFMIKSWKDVPLQENRYDCGVFLCQYVERISRMSSLNFNQKDLDIACARERMKQELLEGKINPEWRMVNWGS